MAPKHFLPGQRWISDSEPELGLGTVVKVNERTVTVAFGASEETRDYARGHAPLRRVEFRAGDSVKDRQDRTWTVKDVREEEGLLTYLGEHGECPEGQLSHAISFSKPQDRLRTGQCDAPAAFDLRFAALRHRFRTRKSPVRGFLGGRIELIPHQLAVASEVTSREAPRVLLADEVGLGKTIEACLILQRLLGTGQAQRALILLPDSLIHQWFVELLRRFNLWFHIFDEARCQGLEATSPSGNPFLDDQLVLCPLSLLAQDERRLTQAKEAGWDLLVVDEAHHLHWSPVSASPEYAAVEALGQSIPGLLLLTATPEQLGQESHFARLRLLDPDRFFDLEAFKAEAAQYQEVAKVAGHIMDGQSLSKTETKRLEGWLGKDFEGNPLPALLDLHGTSRVLFRSTRAGVKGFPRRNARMAPLPCTSDTVRKQLAKVWLAEAEAEPANHALPKEDPRWDWLAGLLQEIAPEKVLLICRTRSRAEAIEAALKDRMKLDAALFHEGLSLVQRDRAAAWFADPEGARLLICSEIGSEGRNFQFAHHLVLFDLPLDPSLLEQRIGRLDRIGQKQEIQIHVPYVEGTAQEVLARWYHEGLNAFQESLPDGREVLERFEAELRELAPAFGPRQQAKLKALLSSTQDVQKELKAQLEAGRDRLLELNAQRPERTSALIQDIQTLDEEPHLEKFLLSALDQHLIEVEELAPRSYRLGSAGVLTENFPGLPEEGLAFTFERERALGREDLQFMTWDHPFAQGTLDLLLGSEKGNSSFARWPDPKASALYLEALLVLEAVAPGRLHVDRFLPPTPMRVIVDLRGEDYSAQLPAPALAKVLRPAASTALLEKPEVASEWVPKMVRMAYGLAHKQVPKLILRARKELAATLNPELERLRALQKINRGVRDEEIRLLETRRQELDQALSEARLRLDAVRLIHRGQ